MSAFLVVLASIALVVFLVRMFWPRRAPEPSEENNWQQRDGSEMPSLTEISAPQTLSDQDVGLGSRIDGVQ